MSIISTEELPVEENGKPIAYDNKTTIQTGNNIRNRKKTLYCFSNKIKRFQFNTK